ncbi:MAG: TetR/AcrR family transcriptional regulator [Tissierellia bacterium]|nr:TetR/AcrR family transcriptional regulator [Tissierellia bacterium]
MAKDTFNNLKPEKKEKVIEVLKKLFQEKPFHEVTVSEIVEKLGIARGSFYQYFEDLEDAYFEILNQEVVDIHRVFVNIIQHDYESLEQALIDYGKELSEILFEKESYMIYKNSYLYWDENLNERWIGVHDYHGKVITGDKKIGGLDLEQMHYLKGVIHTIIKRNYKENWTKEEFIKKYQQYVCWITKGVN